MSDFAIYIFIFLLILGFWLWELRMSRRSRREDNIEAADKIYDDIHVHLGLSEYMLDKLKKDNSMSADDNIASRFAEMIDRHKGEDWVTLNLEALPLTEDCMSVRNSIFPGVKLYLVHIGSPQGAPYKVFYKGRLVGELNDMDSDTIDLIMMLRKISGIYVWEKEGADKGGIPLIRIIVFYQYRDVLLLNLKDESIVRVAGMHPFELIQN